MRVDGGRGARAAARAGDSGVSVRVSRGPVPVLVLVVWRQVEALIVLRSLELKREDP